MKKTIILSLLAVAAFSATAQKNNFSYSFYGFVRGDVFMNSRTNVSPVNDVFYLYPLDKVEDPNGEDLNANPNGSFYSFTTRLGLDIKGPMLGSAQTSAKIETDFGGFSASTTMLRIRQAYIALDWENSQLLMGQTWHPISSNLMPDMLNLSSGAPFNPFNRSPIFRYQYTTGAIKLTGATIWQLQYMSPGPDGDSERYLKNSMLPELYVGIDLATNSGWSAGLSADFISIKPYTSLVGDGATYKVDGRMNAFSYGGYIKYATSDFMVAAKSLLMSGLSHTVSLGGYGINNIDIQKGEIDYTPYRHSSSWVNLTVGSKWKGGLFAGYLKNLGTSDTMMENATFGRGLDIDQLYMINPSFSYNLSFWRIGVEYCLSTAYYGTTDWSDGKVKDTHSVTNHRILGLVTYTF